MTRIENTQGTEVASLLQQAQSANDKAQWTMNLLDTHEAEYQDKLLKVDLQELQGLVVDLMSSLQQFSATCPDGYTDLGFQSENALFESLPELTGFPIDLIDGFVIRAKTQLAVLNVALLNSEQSLSWQQSFEAVTSIGDQLGMVIETLERVPTTGQLKSVPQPVGGKKQTEAA